MDAKSKPGHFVGFEPGTKDTYRIWCEKHTASPDDTQEDISAVSTASETLEPVSLGKRQNSTLENVELPEHETTEGMEDSENISNTTAEERRYPLRERRQPQPYWTANAAPALVPGRSNPLGTTTAFRSSTFEEYGAPLGSSHGDAHSCSVRYRRGGIPVTERSSAVDDAAIEWGYSPLILARNTQLRRWQLLRLLKPWSLGGRIP
eukprot:scaffold2630_cov350-Pavlova_lutheri.AAC.1